LFLVILFLTFVWMDFQSFATVYNCTWNPFTTVNDGIWWQCFLCEWCSTDVCLL